MEYDNQLSESMKLFFPVYGFTLGKVTPEEFKAKGYFVEKEPYGDLVCDVRGFDFWDHNGDKVFEHIFTTKNNALPEFWEKKLGISWRLSYNGWISKFRELGFEIEILEEPHIIEEDDKEELHAEFIATSREKDLSFKLHFGWGNDFGEGATVDSPRSLYSITIFSHFQENPDTSD